MSYLTFKHVDFKTDDKLVLNDINFAIDEGDFVSIVGPSGSGKSTEYCFKIGQWFNESYCRSYFL